MPSQAAAGAARRASYVLGVKGLNVEGFLGVPQLNRQMVKAFSRAADTSVKTTYNHKNEPSNHSREETSGEIRNGRIKSHTR